MARVMYFDLPADDPSRAMAFYEKVFGWKFQTYPGMDDYWGCSTGDPSTPGIDGGLMRRRGEGQPVACTMQVESLDQTIIDLEAAGGTVVVPKMPVPGVGYIAYFKDPENNIFGLFEPAAV